MLPVLHLLPVLHSFAARTVRHPMMLYNDVRNVLSRIRIQIYNHAVVRQYYPGTESELDHKGSITKVASCLVTFAPNRHTANRHPRCVFRTNSLPKRPERLCYRQIPLAAAKQMLKGFRAQAQAH